MHTYIQMELTKKFKKGNFTKVCEETEKRRL